MTLVAMRVIKLLMIVLLLGSCGARKMNKQQSKEVVSVGTHLEEKKDVQVLSNSEIVEGFCLSELDIKADELTVYPDGIMKMTNPHITKKTQSGTKTAKRTDQLIDKSFQLDLGKLDSNIEKKNKEVDQEPFSFSFLWLIIPIAVFLFLYLFSNYLTSPFKKLKL